MLITSALLALLEASRFQELRCLTELQTEVALESVFAKYNDDLWREYHILACKQENLKSGLIDAGNARAVNEDAGSNFFQFVVSDVDIEANTRLTDENGLVFIHAAAEYMKDNLVFEAAKNLYSQYEGMEYLKKSSLFDFFNVKRALEELKKETSEQNSRGSTKEIFVEEYEQKTIKTSKNTFLEDIQKIQERGILSLVIEDTQLLSNKTLELSQLVSQRLLTEESEVHSVDWYTRILFQQYLLHHMSCYIEQKNHAIDYELEYLIGGKGTEIENLKVVINQILTMREAANFTYLMSNPQKLEEARLMAVSIIGGTLNPALIEVVKLGILAAWAFAESILDIRTLLAGGHISLLKNNENWTLDVDYITSIGTGYGMAKNCSNGLSYVDYLGILLLFQEDTNVGKRAMDMEEMTLQRIFKREELRFEEWVVATTVKITYRYSPVFFSVQSKIPNFSYKMGVRKSFSYN